MNYLLRRRQPTSSRLGRYCGAAAAGACLQAVNTCHTVRHRTEAVRIQSF